MSSILLLISPYIKIGKPIAVKIRDFLELSLEVSEALPAIAFFYLSTLALVVYVFVEWCRLDDSARKHLQRWTLCVFESIAAVVLYWRYADLMKDTPYEKFSPLWFVPFIALGYFFGIAGAMFHFAFSLRRSRDEAKRKHLPPMPRQAKEMIIGSILVILLILVPCTVAAFYFYPGPTWWVPCVLLIVSIVPGLPSYRFLFEKHPDGTLPLNRLKAITDWSDHMEHIVQLMNEGPYKGFHQDLFRQRLPAKDIQKKISEKVKEVEQMQISKVSTGFLGVIPDSNPKILVFERHELDGGTRRFEVNEDEAAKWFHAFFQMQKYSGKPFDPKLLENFVFKWANYVVDEFLFRERGSSLLMDHLQRKIEEDLELIIAVDPNLNEQFGGYTPLLQAAADGFIPAVKLLLKHGANTEIANNNGATPFLFAARYDNVELLRILKDAGADIHATDAFGDEALMKAAQWDCSAVAPLLIQWGLDVRRKNHLGRNAYDMATQSKSGKIAILVRRKMMGLASRGSKSGRKKNRK